MLRKAAAGLRWRRNLCTSLWSLTACEGKFPRVAAWMARRHAGCGRLKEPHTRKEVKSRGWRRASFEATRAPLALDGGDMVMVHLRATRPVDMRVDNLRIGSPRRVALLVVQAEQSKEAKGMCERREHMHAPPDRKQWGGRSRKLGAWSSSLVDRTRCCCPCM